MELNTSSRGTIEIIFLNASSLQAGLTFESHMWVAKGNERYIRNLPVYQHDQRSDCQSKIASNQVSLLDIGHIAIHGFLQQKFISSWQISHLHVVMKTIYNFRKKSELPELTLLLPVKITLAYYILLFPGWKWNIYRGLERLTFWFHTHGYGEHTCAPMWAC